MVKNSSLPKGHLAFLLHAHLPFVNNPEVDQTLEQKWLFEATTETYIPLLLSFERLVKEGVDFKLTLSLSPTLLSMITAPYFAEQYISYLDNLLELAKKEVQRTSRSDAKFYSQALFYQEWLSKIKAAFEINYEKSLINPLKKFAKEGCLELITTCATHGFLPLMVTEEARAAQVRAGVSLFKEIFGWLPEGLWLPECAYFPQVEKILEAEGIKYFVMAAHGILKAIPTVTTAVYAPVKIGKVAVYGRDWETSQQVWSRTDGYPGDPAYREFYRDVGYDLDYEYVEPHLVAGLRGDTGLKYFRITGKTDHKEPYDREAALAKAKEHAQDFVENRHWQINYWSGQMKEQPIIVAPYDAELFGHWWFEGPNWLEEVLRLASGKNETIKTVTLAEHLAQNPPRQEVAFGPSSWGEGGFYRYWLNNNTDWTYPDLHRAERMMVALSEGCQRPTQWQKRILNQAGRELLLAQSSDWPFIITSQTMTKYAGERLQNHLADFFKLCEGYQTNQIETEYLEDLETKNHVFPEFDYRMYTLSTSRFIPICRSVNGSKPLVIMLSWEYPPNHVGGLGIHVRYLAADLVKAGMNVHVLTFTHNEQSYSTINEGVYVHFLPTHQRQEEEIDFLAWVLQLNIAMADFGRELIKRFPRMPLILHAHDWLVAYAAKELHETFNMPLVATIHATEHGRNKGLHNHIQHSIHRLEADLVKEATQIICCSKYMESEIENLFVTKNMKIKIIPNGVNNEPIRRKKEPGQKILFIGRLVVEKGVQYLLKAIAELQHMYPDIRLTIAGSGPYARELKNIAIELGIEKNVCFAGFVSEKKRDELLAESDVAVFPSTYEPFGIVALEAMAVGVSVIVSKVGGLAEIVEDGVTGLTANPGDVPDLKRALVTVFQNPGYMQELAGNALQRIKQKYSWEAVARQTKGVYEEVLNDFLVESNVSKVG